MQSRNIKKTKAWLLKLIDELLKLIDEEVETTKKFQALQRLYCKFASKNVLSETELSLLISQIKSFQMYKLSGMDETMATDFKESVRPIIESLENPVITDDDSETEEVKEPKEKNPAEQREQQKPEKKSRDEETASDDEVFPKKIRLEVPNMRSGTLEQNHRNNFNNIVLELKLEYLIEENVILLEDLSAFNVETISALSLKTYSEWTEWTWSYIRAGLSHLDNGSGDEAEAAFKKAMEILNETINDEHTKKHDKNLAEILLVAVIEIIDDLQTKFGESKEDTTNEEEILHYDSVIAKILNVYWDGLKLLQNIANNDIQAYYARQIDSCAESENFELFEPATQIEIITIYLENVLKTFYPNGTFSASCIYDIISSLKSLSDLPNTKKASVDKFRSAIDNLSENEVEIIFKLLRNHYNENIPVRDDLERIAVLRMSLELYQKYPDFIKLEEFLMFLNRIQRFSEENFYPDQYQEAKQWLDELKAAQQSLHVSEVLPQPAGTGSYGLFSNPPGSNPPTGEVNAETDPVIEEAKQGQKRSANF